MNLSREQWALVITQAVALIAYIARGPLPDAWQPYIPYIVGVIEAVGGLVTFVFNQSTKAEVAALKAEIRGK